MTEHNLGGLSFPIQGDGQYQLRRRTVRVTKPREVHRDGVLTGDVHTTVTGWELWVNNVKLDLVDEHGRELLLQAVPVPEGVPK